MYVTCLGRSQLKGMKEQSETRRRESHYNCVFVIELTDVRSGGTTKKNLEPLRSMWDAFQNSFMKDQKWRHIITSTVLTRLTCMCQEDS